MEKKFEKGIAVRMPDYGTEIMNIIRGNASPRVLCAQLADFHEKDIGEVLPHLTAAERRKLYCILDVTVLSGIFEYMEENEVSRYLEEMDLKKASAILSVLYNLFYREKKEHFGVCQKLLISLC